MARQLASAHDSARRHFRSFRMTHWIDRASSRNLCDGRGQVDVSRPLSRVGRWRALLELRLMEQIVFGALLALARATPAMTATKAKAPARPFNVVEATIPEMQAALRDGRVTSHELVLQH